MLQPPPWIFFLLLASINSAEDVKDANVTLTRTNRGTETRERRLIAHNEYPTYYLARSYTNEAGERRNVLIPVQANPQKVNARARPSQGSNGQNELQSVNQVPVYSPTQIYSLTPDMLAALQQAGLIPNQATPTPTQPVFPSKQESNHPSAFVYTLTVPVKPKVEGTGPYQQYQQSQHRYAPITSTEKPPATKLYQVERHRFGPRQETTKYTATQLQRFRSTTLSPYTNKVRFELEDARVPIQNSIALQPVSPTYSTQAFTTATPTLGGGLSQYLDSDRSKQFYYAQEDQVQFIPAPTTQSVLSPSTTYTNTNSFVSTPRTPLQPVRPTPSTPAATLHQHFTENHRRPQVEYVKITDIDVSTEPKKANVHNPSAPQYSQTLESGGHSYLQDLSNSQGPPTGNLRYLLEAQNVRINPKPEINFASEGGSLSTPNHQESENIHASSPKPEIIFSPHADLKSTSEPAVEFIQSNEVTFAPEIMENLHTQSEPLPTHEEVFVDSNAVTPAPPQPQYHQYSTESGHPHTAELDYTSGKFPPMVQEAFNILKHADQLPSKVTPNNIDGSIKTLATILQRLQKFQKPISGSPQVKHKEHSSKGQTYPSSGGSTPGKPGVDYPIYSKIPKTDFDCASQRYKGFFGDPATRCQVWHYCDLNGGQASFLCPNGTIFNQVALTCDWWFNVRCSSTSQLYVLNERLYKFILPFSPSFPEDYSGPIVDRYLTAKFKEQEAKNKLKALKALVTTTAPEISSQAYETSTLTESSN